MPRRKKSFKLPFVKFKIHKGTLFNTIGFLIIAAALILLASFFQKGDILILINNKLRELFGFFSVLVSAILFLIGSHFFNTKKLKIIKGNITIGSILIFVALLGIGQSGRYGVIIFTNLKLDFSTFGALVILLITFIIGVILFLNTSIDTFLMAVVKIIKMLAASFKNLFFAPQDEKKTQKKEKIREEFIKDKKTSPTVSPPPLSFQPPVLRETPTSTHQSALKIRPLPKDKQSTWVYPPVSLLSDITQKEADRGDVKHNSDTIEKTLESFGIRAQVAEVNRGPTVTQYAIEIVRGTKLSKITSLSNDLALALAASTGQVRIEAPIPGRSMVGIEIPNKKAEMVTFKKLISSSLFVKNQDPLLVPLGLDVAGNPVATSINKMPHVLIAGTTGSGKSVLLNAWICSFLFRVKPEELRLILVDPKRVELTLYNGIPHLLTEVIVEPEKIISALKWTVAEMENRYKIFSKAGVRNLEGYNELPDVEKIPYIVLIIDELADLMIFAPGEVEERITRIAQMARATGIHLILATQRPSVDVITGLMKANIPTRIAFNVASMIDSRVVLDMPGAEKLLGKGDMLFLPPDQPKPRRIQGPYIAEKDVLGVVKFLKQQTPVVEYTEEITNQKVSSSGLGMEGENMGEKDELFYKSLELISHQEKASASLLQRRFSVGYTRAARILDQLEKEGYVGPSDGSKPRDVIRRPSTETTPQQQE
ncbi:MAG TPA: DNA translocase FtsK [Patescibacteria group bacterium]|nr:DNA translocase FtsK [Patescibacteria group bacterium]